MLRSVLRLIKPRFSLAKDTLQRVQPNPRFQHQKLDQKTFKHKEINKVNLNTKLEDEDNEFCQFQEQQTLHFNQNPLDDEAMMLENELQNQISNQADYDPELDPLDNSALNKHKNKKQKINKKVRTETLETKTKNQTKQQNIINQEMFRKQLQKFIRNNSDNNQYKAHYSIIQTICDIGTIIYKQSSNSTRMQIIKLCNLFIRANVLEHVQKELENITKLTPEKQTNLSNALVILIKVYSVRFEKKNKNGTANISLMVERDGLVVFLRKIKYLTYHIDNKEIDGLCKLMILYSAAHDSLLKVQSLLQIEKAGVASAMYKIGNTTAKYVTPNIFSQILFVIARFTLSNVSGYLRNSVYNFIQRMQPKDWSQNMMIVKSILYSYGKMSIVSDNFIENVNRVCERYQDGLIHDKQVAVRIMICILNLKIITPKQLQQKYPNLFRDALNQMVKTRRFMLNMIRNEIWDTEYWKNYLSVIKPKNFLSKQIRSQIPTAIHHIKLLLSSMPPESQKVIGAEVKRIEEMQIFKKVYAQVSKYHSDYFVTQIQESINSFEREVWRAMRKLGYQIEIQQLVDCVRVDLFFPRRNLIVELNGEDHYIKNLSKGIQTDTQNALSQSKYKIMKLAGRNLQCIKITNSSNPHKVCLQIIQILKKYPYTDLI